MKKVDELTDGRIAVSVILTPRAAKDAVKGWTSTGSLKIFVTAPPVDNAANQNLVRLLSKTLDVRRSDVNIASGRHARAKRVVLPGVCKNRLLSLSDI